MNGNSAISAGSGSDLKTIQVVLGSMDRIEEYQQVLGDLKSTGGTVQGEMVDRVLDNGTMFSYAI
jgi:hypothetical protein